MSAMSEVPAMFDARPPKRRDALAISRLFLENYEELVPGWQQWKAERKRYLHKHGESYFIDRIDRAHVFPTENFGYVATVEDEVAGFAYAIADPGSRVLARLVGLVVDQQFARHNIGTRLEVERQGWANDQERALYGQIPYENEAAQAFYQKSGYREVGTHVLGQTTYRLIEHTPPGFPTLTSGVHWTEHLGNEPLVY
jgi:GNAT superfamily N-acetyltransferase